MGPLESRISEKLNKIYHPSHLVIENESHRHSVPKGSESHFKVIIVSEIFLGMSRVERSRHVYQSLGSEMQLGIHALSQRCFTAEEWQNFAHQLNLNSPACAFKK